jgi:DNA polymerase-3 subunit epsilon
MDYGALLKTLLHELKDGVIVCDPDAKIRLFNQAAEDLFGRGQALCKGESIYSLCFQPPVEQALSLLQYQHELKKPSAPLPYVQFINASISRGHYFRCRVSFLHPLSAAGNSFIIIFEDISTWYAPDNPLFNKIEGFRAPMTNLRAAVENLTEYPEMSPVMRSAFENVLVQESLSLTEAFDSLASSCNVLMQTQNHLTELNTEVLFGYVAHHLRHKNISVAAAPEQSSTVKVDIYGLLLVLDFLVDRIKQIHKQKGVSCEAHIGNQFIYFDFIWPGELLATGAVKAMLEEKLEHSVGEMTVASILHSMDGDIWSLQHENSKSTLRLALPLAIKAYN